MGFGKSRLLVICLLVGISVFAKGAPKKSPIVVVQAVTACAVADRAYAASQAKWVKRWLAEGGIKSDLVGDGALTKDLAGRQLAYLATCQAPTAAQLAALNAFRARGGKVAVLQSYSPALAASMGGSRFVATGADGKRFIAPAVRTQPLSLAPVAGGWWCANLFTSDDEEKLKIRMLLSVADAALGGVSRVAAWDAKCRAQVAAYRAKAQAQVPRAGEIHAVWDHTGEGLYPGDWSRTLRILKANGVTDLFVNVAGAGFAHYPSKVLPASSVCAARGDQLAACLAAARGMGVRVHAWVLCFNATRGSSARLAQLEKQGGRLKDPAGRSTPYLDPSNANVRWMLFSVFDELAAKYPALAGVQLDFVRWYEKAAGKPKRPATSVESFVAEVRNRLRKRNPRLWLTAAVFPKHPSCVASVGQDWESWLAKGLVDYVVPMNYFEDLKSCAAMTARQGRAPVQARRVISGIGVSANESRLNASQVIDQINAARRAGLAGVALFDLDRTLANQILPLLRLGLFR